MFDAKARKTANSNIKQRWKLMLAEGLEIHHWITLYGRNLYDYDKSKWKFFLGHQLNV